MPIWIKSQNPRPIWFESQMGLGNKDYMLKAVIIHSGGPLRGHYYAYIQVQGEWFKCDDDMVTPTNWQTVLKEQSSVFVYENQR